ncbi:hypothetical protein ACX0G7_20025 [Flavitalea antarctica]
MLAIYPSKTAFPRVPNHPWTFPFMIIMLAIVFMLSSFSGPGNEKQDAEISRLQNQVSQIMMPFIKAPDKCVVQYAVVSFILDSASKRLDTIRFQSNLPENVQDKIMAKLGKGIKINWAVLGGDHGLKNKVIKLPVLIANQAKECEKKGNIPANQVAAMLYGMLGTAETTPALIDRNIYLPLTEIVIIEYAGNDNKAKSW